MASPLGRILVDQYPASVGRGKSPEFAHGNYPPDVSDPFSCCSKALEFCQVHSKRCSGCPAGSLSQIMLYSRFGIVNPTVETWRTQRLRAQILKKIGEFLSETATSNAQLNSSVVLYY
jgi:hypothetical protein